MLKCPTKHLNNNGLPYASKPFHPHSTMNTTNPSYTITAGQPFPMGATLTPQGVNFALFSSRAEKIELCLFDANGKETRLTLPDRSGLIHHGFVPNIGVVFGL